MGGVALSLAAAATFGVLAPASKGALAHVGPLRGAAMAYLAAGCVALVALAFGHVAGLRQRGRPASTGDTPRLVGMTVLGGACMAWACDNTLARGASDLDALLVVSIKGLGAGVVSSLTSAGWAALAVSVAGAVLLSVDRHEHAHVHHSIRHTHPHVHDEHHRHRH